MDKIITIYKGRSVGATIPIINWDKLTELRKLGINNSFERLMLNESSRQEFSTKYFSETERSELVG